MKNGTGRIGSLAAALCFVAAQPAFSQTITEFYYTPQNGSLQNLVVNNANNPPPANGILQLVANNIVGAGYAFQYLSPDVWSGQPWTGLNPTDRSPYSQKALGPTGTTPSHGSTVFQVDGQKVGMHLNTFGVTLPTGYTAASLQYFIGFPNGGKTLWDRDDLLCMSGQMNIASSYSAGSVNQVMMTMNFSEPGGKHFWLNVMMFDSRANYQVADWCHWDQQDTNSAIIISHAQSQAGNPNVIYTSPVSGYGNPLTPAATGSPISGSRDYGFCISKAQFQRALTDINAKYPAGLPTNPLSYKLNLALVGPEIETSLGRGHAGMSVSSMWVYRLR
jgi:hypothetical protein